MDVSPQAVLCPNTSGGWGEWRELCPAPRTVDSSAGLVGRCTCAGSTKPGLILQGCVGGEAGAEKTWWLCELPPWEVL